LNPIKHVSLFAKNRASKDGLHNQCNECRWDHYRRNREKILEERRRDYVLNRKKFLSYRSRIGARYSCIKGNAKKRGIPVEISKDQYASIVCGQVCFYCKGPLPSISGGGLDRIDNEKGYTVDNVVPCCGSCNMIKGDNLTHEEMLFVMEKLTAFRAGIVS